MDSNSTGRKYRKIPVVIDAVQFNGTMTSELRNFLREGGAIYYLKNETPSEVGMHILTWEGSMEASVGDWIIRGVKGEYYPCKPDIFEMTYVKDEDTLPERIMLTNEEFDRLTDAIENKREPNDLLKSLFMDLEQK